MALTPGFKKFVGIVGIVAVMGGGYVYWKQMPHPVQAPQAVEQIVEAPVQQAQPPAAEVQEAPAPVEAPRPVVRAAPAHDVSSNRGMNAVLEAGSRK